MISQSYFLGGHISWRRQLIYFFSVLAFFNIGMGKDINAQHCLTQMRVNYISFNSVTLFFSSLSKSNLISDKVVCS